MIDISEKLPKEILDDGAKLYKIKCDGMYKFIIINENRNYRSFLYVSNTRQHMLDHVDSLLSAYRSETNVYSETQKFSMGLITKRGGNGTRDV